MATSPDRHQRPTARLAVIGVAALLLAACGSSAGTSSSVAPAPVSSPAGVAATGATLTIANFAFGQLTVKGGQTITVTNSDPADHTVTIAAEGIDVKVPAQGQATFTAPAKAGTYALTCDFHKQMTGTLVVTT
jgi:plastocyanin